MRKTKRTLRRTPPIARELAKLANDLDRINRRLLKLAEKVIDLEADAAAYADVLNRLPSHTMEDIRAN